MKQKNSFLFGQDFFSRITKKNKLKTWEMVEEEKENKLITNKNIKEVSQQNSLKYNYEKIVLQPSAIAVKSIRQSKKGINTSQIKLNTDTKTIEIDNRLDLNQIFNVSIEYSSNKLVDELKDEFNKIARLFEGYESNIYASVDNEDNIAIPFENSNDVYNIEYGTYEFLHHFFAGNLAKKIFLSRYGQKIM